MKTHEHWWVMFCANVYWLMASYFLNKVTCTRKSLYMNLQLFCGIMITDMIVT